MKQFMSRLLVGAALTTGTAAPVLAADPYPARPVMLVVPAPPGGSTDRLGRLVGGKVAESLGQPMVLDFKPGASGMLAQEAVARATPDGHVVLMDQSAIAMNPVLQKGRMRFDIQKDLQPVTALVRFQHMLVVPSILPVKSIQDLVAYVKAHPGKVNYSSPGSGTPQHVLMELFMRAGGIGATHIPYKGGAQALLAAASGEVQMTILSISTGGEMVKSGRVRVLAVMDDTRAATLPEAPTFAELGYRGLNSPWIGIFVPGATPAAVVQRLNTEFVKALKDNQVRAALAEAGMQPVGSSPAELARLVSEELALNEKLVKELKLAAD